ncbi:MAG: glycosyltransferase [Eubacteriales bacterium]|nr:glycosyltransferase [Eubacteriales bacterium]
MKLFQLNTYGGTGSTGRIALGISRRLTECGGESRIGFGAGQAASEAEPYALRIGSPWERKLHGAMRKLLDAEGYGSQVATGALLRFLNDYQPDVIQLHNLHGCYLNLPMLFRWLARAGVPIVWTLHDCWPFTGHCAYFDFAKCDRWQTGCHDCPQLRSYPTCIGLDGSRRNYEQKRRLWADLPNLTLVTPCQWMADLLAQSFLRSHPVRVICNGVNTQTFFKNEETSVNPRIFLAVASEWEERKGLRFLLNQPLQKGEQLVILGLSEAQLQALPQGVAGLARTASTQELCGWYSRASCFLNPTLEDNMPMVNLEALACGTPVAAFDTGGCRECVDESCGRIVAQGDGRALFAAARELGRQKSELSAACMARAHAFDESVANQAYLNLYKELCS